MTRILILFVGLVVLVIAGGFAYLAAFDIPAPRTKVEKVIPNDRLGK